MVNFAKKIKIVFKSFRDGQRIRMKDLNKAYFSYFSGHDLNDYYLFRRVVLAKGILAETTEKDFIFNKLNYEKNSIENPILEGD